MNIADGLILATDGNKTLFLVEPDPGEFKAIVSAELLKEEVKGTNNEPQASRAGGPTQNWAPIALADGKLLVRDQSRLLYEKAAE
jgi:hypothetical protein